MKSDYCHVTLLLDNSGSMRDCWDETISSLKSFIEQQQKIPGKFTLSLYTFNDRIHQILGFVDINDKFNNSVLDNIVCSGWTAMWDAAQFTINHTGEYLSKITESERPSKVLFVALTDGGENSSKKATMWGVKNMIQHQKDKYNWQFVFLGADFDVAMDASSVGVQSFNYVKSNTVNTISHGLSNSVSNYRGILASSYNAADINS